MIEWLKDFSEAAGYASIIFSATVGFASVLAAFHAFIVYTADKIVKLVERRKSKNLILLPTAEEYAKYSVKTREAVGRIENAEPGGGMFTGQSARELIRAQSRVLLVLITLMLVYAVIIARLISLPLLN